MKACKENKTENHVYDEPTPTESRKPKQTSGPYEKLTSFHTATVGRKVSDPQGSCENINFYVKIQALCVKM